MTITDKAAFAPNCVFIPAHSVWKDSRGEHVDPTDAILMMLDGDNNYGEVFTSEAWENDGQPRYQRRYGQFVDADNNPIAPEHGRVELLPELFVVKIDEREYWLDPVVLGRTKAVKPWRTSTGRCGAPIN